jgi:hypothetical protein
VMLHQLAVGSTPPLQEVGADSKYFPVALPLVDRMMKILPPPGPVSPIA